MTQPDWFSYGEIRYTLDQVLFLLAHKELLESGHWPPQHNDSGYIGSSKGRAYKAEGYFVKPVIIIAELNVRLEAAGDDGELVVERYTGGYDEMDIAEWRGLDYWEVVKKIDTALSYCQGGNRKRTKYQAYKARRSFYLKERRPSLNA